MKSSNVINDLHVAFATLRNATFTDCPGGVDFVLTGNGNNWLTLSIETKINTVIVDLVTYKISIDANFEDCEHLTIRVRSAEIANTAQLLAMNYATRIVLMADNIVISTCCDYRAI